VRNRRSTLLNLCLVSGVGDVLVSLLRTLCLAAPHLITRHVGAHFAELSMLLNVASILATFRIEKALDVNGKEVEPVVEWLSGLTSFVLSKFSNGISQAHGYIFSAI
jgi:hypothetical protein